MRYRTVVTVGFILGAGIGAGCAPVAPHDRLTCLAPAEVPAPRGKHESIGKLEIRVELARELDHKAAVDCAVALEKAQKK